MSQTRLPSFNDFSPEILKQDVRVCLKIVKDGLGNDTDVIKAFAKEFFGGVANQRSHANIPATLTSTGLVIPGRPLQLSDFGQEVLAAPDEVAAAQCFCAGIIRNGNGIKLLEAIHSLRKRDVIATKANLKDELQRIGVTNLSAGTTDHLTLKNWMVKAGFVCKVGRFYEVNESVLASVTGISFSTKNEFELLPFNQQVFLRLLSKRQEVESGPFPATELLKACKEGYPHEFRDDAFARTVRDPLVEAGWIEVEGLAKGKQGGKSGRIKGTSKINEIPPDELISPRIEQVPADLRAKISWSLPKIKDDLLGGDKYKGGIALELLAFRMLWDLGLEVRGMRVRSSQTGYAETDLIAEGSHLLFSRWTVQCKRTAARVPLEDVAKEVGIATVSKAHVIVMITTSDFTRDAYEYAHEVTNTNHLQFLFINGQLVQKYLNEDRAALWEYVLENARQVMMVKRGQKLVFSVDEPGDA